jgi:hypothetical protein
MDLGVAPVAQGDEVPLAVITAMLQQDNVMTNVRRAETHEATLQRSELVAMGLDAFELLASLLAKPGAPRLDLEV